MMFQHVHSHNQTSDLDTGTLQDGSNAGDITEGIKTDFKVLKLMMMEQNYLQFFMERRSQNTRLLEYQLSTAYD